MEEKLGIKSAIEDLTKALDKLEEAIDFGSEPELNRDGTIQRFEFSFELSWKLLKIVNNFLGTECFSPRDCIRLAAQNGLIENPEDWLKYLNMRNLASHTYSESSALEVYNSIPGFEKTARELINSVNDKL